MPTDKGAYIDELSTAIQLSSLPAFTGSLELFLRGGIGHIIHGW